MLPKKPQCYGTTTIGPKGQIVIPAKLRKELAIKTGEQFLVFKNEHFHGIVIIKTKEINNLLKSIVDELSILEKKNN
jgi:AbrB family looped-hinge helix DNA binding protein